MIDLNFEYLVSLEGRDKKIDNFLYELFDKYSLLNKIESDIKLYQRKDKIKRIFDCVSLLLMLGTIIMPNLFVVSYISFCILRLFFIRFLGTKTGGQRLSFLKNLRMKKSVLESEIVNLVAKIEKIEKEYDEGLSLDSDFDNINEKMCSYVFNGAKIKNSVDKDYNEVFYEGNGLKNSSLIKIRKK